MTGPELVPDAGPKEQLVSAIEAALEDGILNKIGTRKLAERTIVVMADFARSQTPGPTGKFPEGKLNEGDEGQIRMLISADEKLVQIDFGKPVAWFAMPKAQALTFAFNVLEKCGVKIEHSIQQDPAPGEPV